MDCIDLISGVLITEGSVPALILEVTRLSTSEANSSVGQVRVETSSRSFLLILLVLGVQLIAMVWISVGVAKGPDRVFLAVNLLLDVDHMSFEFLIIIGQGQHFVLEVVDHYWEFLKRFGASWGLFSGNGPLKDLNGSFLDNRGFYLILLRV